MEGVEGVEGVAGEIVATTLTDGIGACKRGHQEDRTSRLRRARARLQADEVG